MWPSHQTPCALSSYSWFELVKLLKHRVSGNDVTWYVVVGWLSFSHTAEHLAFYWWWLSVFMFWFKCRNPNLASHYRKQFTRGVHRTVLRLNFFFFFCERSRFVACHHSRLSLKMAQEAGPSLRGDKRGCYDAKKQKVKNARKRSLPLSWVCFWHLWQGNKFETSARQRLAAR